MASSRPSQQRYKEAMARGRSQEAIEAARRVDKTSHATLNRLRACAENSECFDCTATKPGWAALPHGVFVCIDCAQNHRNLGRHISQTKAINTGTYLWMDYELAVMQDVGNAVAGRAFAGCGLPPKPSRDAAPPDKLAYAKAKYAGNITPSWEKSLPTTRPELQVPHPDPSTKVAPTPAHQVKAPTIPRPASPTDLIVFDEEVVPRNPPPGARLSTKDPDDFFAQFGL